MGKVLLGLTMSLDGFIADRNGDLNPLYPDLDELRKTEMLQESIRITGAALMGRRAYDLGQGDFTGYEFQVPIFVVTHHAPEKAAKGENGKLSFNFVTDGIESAVAKARAASGDKYVIVIGGASIDQQIIKAGLFDELLIGLAPIMLGDGLRVFEHLDGKQFELQRMKVIESPNRTDIRYRVVK